MTFVTPVLPCQCNICVHYCINLSVYAGEPVRLEHVSEREEVLSVEQGKPFSLNVQCVDSNGEITTLGTAT